MLRPSFLLLASAQGRPALDEAHPLVSAAGLLDTSATHPLPPPVRIESYYPILFRTGGGRFYIV